MTFYPNSTLDSRIRCSHYKSSEVGSPFVDFLYNATNTIPKDGGSYVTNHKCAYAMMIDTPAFILPARVWAYSLQRVNTQADIVALVVENTLTVDEVGKLVDAGIKIKYEKVIESVPGFMASNRFDTVDTKFRIFNWTEYDKIAIVDADTVATQNPDWVFDLDGFWTQQDDKDDYDSVIASFWLVQPDTQIFNQLLSLLSGLKEHYSVMWKEQAFIKFVTTFSRNSLSYHFCISQFDLTSVETIPSVKPEHVFFVHYLSGIVEHDKPWKLVPKTNNLATLSQFFNDIRLNSGTQPIANLWLKVAAEYFLLHPDYFVSE
ncbi:hypothetical protein PCE1_000885 [Barthelona sp. PCE]